MFGMVLQRVLITDLTRVVSDNERKIVAVGVSKILCETPCMLVMPYRAYWTNLIHALITSFETPPDTNPLEADSLIEQTDDVGYQAAYSQLTFAKLKVIDPLPDIDDGRKFLAQCLAKLSIQRPGEVPTLILSLPNEHQQALQKYCAQAEVQIV